MQYKTPTHNRGNGCRGVFTVLVVEACQHGPRLRFDVNRFGIWTNAPGDYGQGTGGVNGFSDERYRHERNPHSTARLQGCVLHVLQALAER